MSLFIHSSHCYHLHLCLFYMLLKQYDEKMMRKNRCQPPRLGPKYLGFGTFSLS